MCTNTRFRVAVLHHRLPMLIRTCKHRKQLNSPHALRKSPGRPRKSPTHHMGVPKTKPEFPDHNHGLQHPTQMVGANMSEVCVFCKPEEPDRTTNQPISKLIINGNSQPANHQPTNQVTSPNYKLIGWLVGWWLLAD